jgi:hypothetical protein
VSDCGYDWFFLFESSVLSVTCIMLSRMTSCTCILLCVAGESKLTLPCPRPAVDGGLSGSMLSAGFG